jgi:hypothetical protein
MVLKIQKTFNLYPRYTYPPRLIAGLLWDWILMRRRSFRKDACDCIGRLEPPLRVLGSDYIPHSGPCVITPNHYYRPGFNAWWLALAITSVVPVDMHWVMTSELTFPGKWYAPIGMLVSRIMLKRAARLYGFTPMPPMPPRSQDVTVRANAVRRVLSYTMKTTFPVLGLAPEGGDMPGGRLDLPASGAGRFILLLAARGLSLVPVGVFEQDGTFCLNFGPAYHLHVPAEMTPDEKDKRASTIIMEHIAIQMPSHLRGAFHYVEEQ